MAASSQATLDSKASSPAIPQQYLFPFILVATLFALWGFANDITNSLVHHETQL